MKKTLAFRFLLPALALAFVLSQPSLLAQNSTFNILTGIGAWATPGHWTPSGSPNAAGATALFNQDITGAVAVNVVGNFTVGNMSIGDSNGTHGYTLQSTGNLTLDNSGSASQINFLSTGTTNTITGITLRLNNSLDIANSSAATQSIQSAISSGTAGLKTITNLGAGTGDVSMSGAITNGSGTTAIIQNSANSTLSLGNTGNTFSGGVTIQSGTVAGISASAAFGNGTLTLGNTSGSANATVAGNSSGATYANAISVAAGNNGTATISSLQASTFSGPITLNTHDLYFQTNGGTLVSNGGVSGTGNLFLSAGANNLTLSGTTVNHTGTITNSGTGNGTTTISSAIGTNVTGVVQNSTTSTLVLNGNSTFSTGVLIKSGTLQVDTNTTALGTGTLTLGNSAGSANSTLLINSIALTSGGISVASGNTGTAKIVTTANNASLSGNIALNNHDLFVESGRLFTLSGSVTGTGNLTINIPGTGFNLTFTGLVNNVGTITSSSNGSAYSPTTFSGGIGSNVTAITFNSTSTNSTVSGLLSTGALTVNSAGTTITNSNPSGTQIINVSGGVVGTGNLILNNNSAIANGISIGAVNNTGTITNSGTGTGNTSISGVIGSSVTSITQNSANSVLTLSGANTFTGGLNIQQGTVQVGSATGVGAGTVTIGNTGTNGTLDLNGQTETVIGLATAGTAGNQTIANSSTTANAILSYTGATTSTFGGVIKDVLGSGNKTTALTVNNSGGILTLTGANTYTGATTVSAGLLKIGSGGSLASGSAVGVSGGALGGNGTVNGAVTVSSTGGINLADGAVGTLTLGSTLAITGAASANNLLFDLANAGSTTDKIAATGAVTMTTAGAGVISLNQLGGSANRVAAGTYDLITGSAVPVSGNFTLATTKAFGQTFALTGNATKLQVTTAQVTGATQNSTTLAGASASWATATNFTQSGGGNALPDYQSNVIINSNVGTSPLNGSTDINSLTFGTAATTGVTISAGTASAGTPASMLVIEAAAVNGNTAGNGITVNTPSSGTPTQTISSKVGLAANQTWTVNTGAALTVSGVVSDFGGGYTLTKGGSGTLTLSGANTFTGGITINAGTLAAITDANALGAGSTAISLGGTTGSANATLSVSGITSSRAISVTSGNSGTASISGGPSASTLSGAITLNNHDLLIQFTHNLNLSGGITGTGNLTYAENSPFTITSTGPSINNVGTITNSGTGAAGTTTFTANIGSNVTQVIQNSPTASLRLQGNNGFGSLLIRSGTVTMQGAALNTVLGSGTVLLGDTSGSANATLELSNVFGAANNVVVQAGNSGTATFQSGAAAVTPYDGQFTLNRDLYVKTSGTASITLTGITTGAALSGAGNLIYSTTGNGSGGSSVLLVNGSNTGFTGNVIINSGPLSIGSTTAFNVANTVTVNSGSIASFNLNNFNLTIAGLNGDVTGTGRVYNSSANVRTLTLGGSGTYAFGGKLEATTPANLNVTKTGAGTQTLTGLSTYTGITTITGGVLDAGTLANGGGNSSIGASASAATNLVIDGGTLRYSGTGGSTDRLFTIGTSGATLDASGSGAITFAATGAAVLAGNNTARTVTLTGNNTGDNTLAVTLGDNGSGATSLTKNGTGRWVMTGTNTYTGLTTVSAGTLAYGASNVISTGAVTVNGATAVLDLKTFSDSVGTVTLDGGGAINSTTGALTTTGTFEVKSGSASAILAGAGAALNKTTSGTVTLSGNNTYTGATTVTSGTLLVSNTSGSGLGSGNATVNGGTLGGAGSFTGTVTVNSGGFLAPGASIESLKSGAVSFNTGSTFSFELDSGASTSVGADLQVASGDLNLNGTVTLTLTNLAVGTFANNTKFTLINYSGAWNSGLFTYDSFSRANGSTFSFNGQTWQIDYNATVGGSNFTGDQIIGANFVNITVVPEPSTVAMFGLGLTVLLYGFRRRKG